MRYDMDSMHIALFVRDLLMKRLSMDDAKERKIGEKSMYKRFVKRAFDIVLSLLAIIVLALPMLVLAIIIKLDSKGPVLFTQTRYGLHKSHFRILKFRTMRIDAPPDAPTYLLDNPDQWITRWGRFLRKSSLDELPQIFNIFIGQMSIIGPRPVVLGEVSLIEERDKYGANDVRPGLTGWAQINGRDELDMTVKAQRDGEYAAALNAGKGKGFWMDLKCLFITVKSVLKHEGVVEGGAAAREQEERELEAAVK